MREAETKPVESLVEEEPEFAEFAPDESESSEEGSSESESWGERAQEEAEEDQREQEEGEEEEIAHEEVIADSPPAAPVVMTEEASGPPSMPHPKDTEAREAYDAAALKAAQEQAGTATTVLMVIEPPNATDADGAPVPSALAVDGKTVTLTLERSSKPHIPSLSTLTSSHPPTPRQPLRRTSLAMAWPIREPKTLSTPGLRLFF